MDNWTDGLKSKLESERNEYLLLHPYKISLFSIRPYTSGVYDYRDFRLKSDKDIETITERFFKGESNLKLTYFENTTNVCLHRGEIHFSKTINNFIFRGVTIQGDGVIFGMDKDGKILEKPSERPLRAYKRFDKQELKPENIIETHYNDFRPTHVNWSEAGEDEMRKMDDETDGSWRIENDFG